MSRAEYPKGKRRVPSGRYRIPIRELEPTIASWRDCAKRVTPQGYDSTIVCNLVESFYRNFFAVQGSIPAHNIKSFTDGCKSRANDLKSLLEFAGNANALGSSFIIHYGNDKRSVGRVNASSLLVPDIWHSKGAMIFCNQTEEVWINHRDPKVYGPLVKAMLICMAEMRYTLSDGMSNLMKLIVSAANIYQKMNLPDSEKDQIIRDEIQLLSGASHGNPEKFSDLFEQVWRDIEEGKLPYIRNMKRALDRTLVYRQSLFEEKDYYYSLKTSSSEKVDRRSNSLIQSLFESDPLKGSEIETALGYESNYVDDGISYDLDKTILIDNPSKVKPRPIHISINAMQDLGSYVHRRLQSILRELPEDCTLRQDNGVRFVEARTRDLMLKDEAGNLYNADFTDATGTEDSACAEMILSKVLLPAAVEFWHYISKCEKTFYFPNGSKVNYSQITGQPQGLLGSFDVFALHHHFIMLMTMKASGLENNRSDFFYRVLGDDSSIYTIRQDPDLKVLHKYYEICEWSNFHINKDKTTILVGRQYDEDSFAFMGNEDDIICHAGGVIDFAKVSVSKGEVITPIPARLIKAFSPKGDLMQADTADTLCFMSWCANHNFKLPLTEEFCKEMFGEVDGPLGYYYLARFHTKEFCIEESAIPEENPVWDILCGYAKAYAELEGSLLAGILRNHIYDMVDRDDPDLIPGFKELVHQDFIKEQLGKVPENHKFRLLLSHNLQLGELVNVIFRGDSPEAYALLVEGLELENLDLPLLDWMATVEQTGGIVSWIQSLPPEVRDTEIRLLTKSLMELDLIDIRFRKSYKGAKRRYSKLRNRIATISSEIRQLG